MAKSPVERIATLSTELEQLELRQQRLEARRRTLAARRSRAADTRRKILVGAIVLAKVEQGVMDGKRLRRWLDQALNRPHDRGLFGL